MSALQSRRLRYGVGAIRWVFVLLAALRLVFVLEFSGLDLNTPALLKPWVSACVSTCAWR